MHSSILSGILERLSSGPMLPAESGVPARELEIALAALRSEGCRIGLEDGRYVLHSAAGFGPGTLSWRLGREVVFHALTATTNRDASRLALASSPIDLVVADAQYEGRGRHGRPWQSPPGLNLYLSMILRPDLPAIDAPLVGIAAGAAVARALDLRVKWPNDVVTAEGQKVGGMLAEMDVREGRLGFIVLGVGINVNQTSFPADLPLATSIALVRGERQDRALILADVVSAVRDMVAVLERDRGAVLEVWRERSWTLGQRVQVQLGVPTEAGLEGADTLDGLAEEIRDDGALLVRDDSGTLVAVVAGDVVRASAVRVRRERSGAGG